MRPIGLLLCLTISAQAIAQSPAAAEPPFSTKGAFFGLSVADLEASVRWYSEKLGMKVALRPQDPRLLQGRYRRRNYDRLRDRAVAAGMSSSSDAAKADSSSSSDSADPSTVMSAGKRFRAE